MGDGVRRGPAAAPRRTVADRYELLAPLGRGGMGHVFLAFDRTLRRRVALKIPRGTTPVDGRTLDRLRREARVAAMLSHPNVVAVHDVVIDHGTPYLVMEFVPGTSLSAAAAAGPLEPMRAAEIAEAVAAALAHAHRAGVVHRDVSPSNVMLTPSGRVKVLDFGVARTEAVTPSTEPDAVIGTLEYLSPEHARAGRVDARSDLYSLGAVLYLMLTGRPPFRGDAAALVHAHLLEAPRSPDELVPGLPPALVELTMRCLAKDPADRPPRAEDVQAALRELRGPGDPEPRPAPDPQATAPVPGAGETAELTEPDGRRRRRRRRSIAVIAVSLVIVGMLLSGIAWTRGRTPAAGPAARPAAPAPPSHLTARGRCAGFLRYRSVLSWTPTTSSRADGYRVYRSARPEGPYELVATVAGRAAHTYTDAGLGSAADYYYVVRAASGLTLGGPSGVALASTPLVCVS